LPCLAAGTPATETDPHFLRAIALFSKEREPHLELVVRSATAFQANADIWRLSQ